MLAERDEVIDSIDNDDLKLVHCYCPCDPWRGMCGYKLTSNTVEATLDCVVCIELEPLPCPKCGE